MWQFFTLNKSVIASDLTHMVGACTVRAKNNVAFGYTLAYRPRDTAGQARSNLGFIWSTSKIHRDELFIECSPFIGQPIRQIDS